MHRRKKKEARKKNKQINKLTALIKSDKRKPDVRTNNT
jgi:hypothetical protein